MDNMETEHSERYKKLTKVVWVGYGAMLVGATAIGGVLFKRALAPQAEMIIRTLTEQVKTFQSSFAQQMMNDHISFVQQVTNDQRAIAQQAIAVAQEANAIATQNLFNQKMWELENQALSKQCMNIQLELDNFRKESVLTQKQVDTLNENLQKLFDKYVK